MLHLARKVTGATVRATDGDIGTLEDFYFEEDRWTVRYLLVDTGTWFSGKRVLISPMSVQGRWGMASVSVNLTKDQVWNSPEFDVSQPLSRASETKVSAYYAYPDYWGDTNVWGRFDNPAAFLAARADARMSEESSGIATEARHLRSTSRSTGYHLHATDGEIGHVDDFLIGQESWRIRYLLVDTSNWIGGRWVIVSCDVLAGIDQRDERLRVNTTRNEIEQAPSLTSIEEALDAAETGPPFTFI